MKTNPEIRTAIDSIRVIDTHEHQEEESARLKRPNLDFITLFEQYASDDLIVAGMAEKDWQRCVAADTPLDEKWRLFEPHYRSTRNTAYVKAVEIAVRDLYDIEELRADTVDVLTERMRQRNQPGIVQWILQEKSGIDLGQVNALDAPFYRADSDRSLFMQDLGLAGLLGWPLPIADLEKESGITIKSFKQYAGAIDAMFARHARHACAVKQQSAYWRAQRFEDVPDADAERVFDEAAKKDNKISEDRQTMLQDWAMHRCVRLCIEHHLPIKIHTGYKAGHNYMDVQHIQPTQLTNLFVQYPEAKFDLFHIGYPYQEEVLALAKHFANVHVDMCWAWIIDAAASSRFLKQFITAVPANKLFAFGGDYIVAEPVYGHLRIARHHIARVLTELVEEEYLSISQAISIARRILRENALEVFQVEEKRHG